MQLSVPRNGCRDFLGLTLVAYLSLSGAHALGKELRIPPQAMKSWKQYEEAVAHRLQGSVQRTVTSRSVKRKLSTSYKQNRDCALMITVGAGRDQSVETCELACPFYAAVIKRKISNPQEAVLQNYQSDPHTIFTGRPANFIDEIFSSTSPHFTYCNIRLTELIVRPEFRIDGITDEVIDRKKCLRVDFHYTHPLPNKPNSRRVRTGSILLDPAKCWSIHRIKESSEITQDEVAPYAHTDTTIDFEASDHPSGFPIIKTQTLHDSGTYYKPKRNFNGSIRYDYELEVKDPPPNSEFTLTAFGLPEPVGMEPVKQPIPMYIWILIADAFCGAIALVFRYLARRRGLAAATV